MKKPLKDTILEVKEQLQADDKEMARHLKLSVAFYKSIESGARVLPLPSRKTIERRMERLLKVCGISMEPGRQK